MKNALVGLIYLLITIACIAVSTWSTYFGFEAMLGILALPFVLVIALGLFACDISIFTKRRKGYSLLGVIVLLVVFMIPSVASNFNYFYANFMRTETVVKKLRLASRNYQGNLKQAATVLRREAQSSLKLEQDIEHNLRRLKNEVLTKGREGFGSRARTYIAVIQNLLPDKIVLPELPPPGSPEKRTQEALAAIQDQLRKSLETVQGKDAALQTLLVIEQRRAGQKGQADSLLESAAPLGNFDLSWFTKRIDIINTWSSENAEIRRLVEQVFRQRGKVLPADFKFKETVRLELAKFDTIPNTLDLALRERPDDAAALIALSLAVLVDIIPLLFALFLVSPMRVGSKKAETDLSPKTSAFGFQPVIDYALPPLLIVLPLLMAFGWHYYNRQVVTHPLGNDGLLNLVSGQAGKAHERAVTAIAVSPDGRYFATVGVDGGIKVWEAEGGRLKFAVKAAQAAGDIELTTLELVSRQDDNTLERWSLKDGRPIAGRTLFKPGEKPGWLSLDFAEIDKQHPERAKIHIKSERPPPRRKTGALRILGENRQTNAYWIDHGAPIAHVFRDRVDRVDRVVSVGQDGLTKVWRVKPGKLVKRIQDRAGEASLLALLPDGQRALVGGAGNEMSLVDLATGKRIRSFKGHEDFVWGIAVSRDGKTAVSGSFDNTIRLWDVETGRQTRLLKGHNGNVRGVAISPDQRYILSGSADRLVNLWNLETGTAASFKGHEAEVMGVAFSPDGKRALSGDGKGVIKLWDVEKRRLVRTITGHGERIGTVVFSPDGKTALSGSFDKTLRIWDLASGKPLTIYKGHTRSSMFAAFTPDGRHVLSASEDGTAHLWAALSGRTLRVFELGADTLNGVAVSKDGRTAIVADGNGIVADGKGGVFVLKMPSVAAPIATIRGHGDVIAHAAISPDGSKLLTADLSGHAQITDLSKVDWPGIAPDESEIAGGWRQGMAVTRQKGIELATAMGVIKPEKPEVRVSDNATFTSYGKFTAVRLFYATGRQRSDSDKPETFYTGAPSDPKKISYGISTISVPKTHRAGRLEAPSAWKIEFREDSEKHVVLHDIAPDEKQDMFARLKKVIGKSKSKSAFVFVHGYNVTFRDAARRTAQMAFDLNFEGAPILYSWPSLGTLTDYVQDESTIDWAQNNLKDYLKDLVQQTGAENIYLLAHGMGNRALTGAVATLVEEDVAFNKRFRAIMLAAPDMDARIFRDNVAPKLVRAANNVTLYVSNDDKALQASRIFHGAPLAGQAGADILIIPGIDTIDATGLGASLLAHSYFAESRSILGDVLRIVRDGGSPALSRHLKEVVTKKGSYWRFMAFGERFEPEPESRAEALAEFYPEEISKRLERHNASLKHAGLADPDAMRGIYSSVHLWPIAPDDGKRLITRINVCFFDGAPRLQKQVVQYAMEWTRAGGFVPLDFGPPERPRQCTGRSGNEHIRISFKRGRGIWSAVGWQSMVPKLFPANKPSMNFGIDPRQIAPKKFRRAVLHEFGHALGLEHMHQIPFLQCWDKEYDKPKLLSYLKRERGWGLLDAKRNLQILQGSGIVSTRPDKNSIMMFSFPAKYYKRGKKSPCYAEERAELSAGDRALIRQLYPASRKARSRLSAGRRKLMRRQLELVRRKLRTGPKTR